MYALLLVLATQWGAEPGSPTIATVAGSPTIATVAGSPTSATVAGSPTTGTVSETILSDSEVVAPGESNTLIDGESTVMDQSEGSPWGFRRMMGSGYFSSEFLYWDMTSPRQHGAVVGLRSVTLSPLNPQNRTTTTSIFETGQPNPDKQMGFRMLLGRQLTDSIAAEVGGFWVHPFDYYGQFAAGTSTQSGISGQTTVTTNTPFFAPIDRDLVFTNFLYLVQYHSVDPNLRLTFYRSPRIRWDGLAGVRYLNYTESFDIFQYPTAPVRIRETFNTFNYYVGGQIGTELQIRFWEYCFLGLLAKGATGSVFQEASINGPGAPGGINAGLLTGPGNLGVHNRTSSGAVAEFGIKITGALTPNLYASIGYTGIWVSNVLRAMDQMDLPSAAQRSPAFSYHLDSVWLTGVTTGLEFRW